MENAGLETRLCNIISQAIKEATSRDTVITIDSRLNEPKEWDSLSFMHVYYSVLEEFNLDEDDDDILKFRSVVGILEVINEN